MGKIIKTGIFNGFARVTFIDVTDVVNEEIKIHDLSPLCAAALGRTLSAGAYIGANLKAASDTFSLTVTGDGPIGGVVVAGGPGNIRGYVNESRVDLPPRADGHLDVGGGIGKGYLTVVKDLGLKDPYVGRCELVTGEIAEDFAKYLLVSEGVRSAVALGVRVNADGCIAAGGIIAEALPGITEDMLVILEDVMTNFGSVTDVLQEKSIEEIYDFYFSHLDGEIYATEKVDLVCNCSEERIVNLIKSLGKKECDEIIAEQGKIEAVCHFCEKRYAFGKEEVDALWRE
ncbi:MAG: Hsp33 family molecular chaperone HslO [Clostridia bacterium]|nr:Hsp33 family molecular chaperone HslO [Clostridia bacterium]